MAHRMFEMSPFRESKSCRGSLIEIDYVIPSYMFLDDRQDEINAIMKNLLFRFPLLLLT